MLDQELGQDVEADRRTTGAGAGEQERPGRGFRLRDDFRRAQLAIAALFWALGFQYGTWASRLPTIKARLDLSTAEVGLLLMACGAGAAASFPLVAVLTKRLGSRRLACLSAVCLGLLLPALAVAPDYPVALVIVCCDGILVGCLNVAMNAQGAALEVVYDRRSMGKFHATFSAGSLCAALLASGMNLLTSSLLAHFAVAAAILLLLIAYARPGLLPQDQQPEPEPKGESTQAEPKQRRLPLPSRVTIWMGLAMAFGTVTEGAMNDWSALYLKNVAKAAAELAPMGIAVVSVMMVLARVFADGWRARWGDARIVRVGSALAGLGLAVALLVGGVVPALLGFACVGLGVAAVTPCVYMAAARQGSDALALVAAMGTTGMLAGPAVIGFIASASSLAWGMGAVAASAVLVSLCSTRINWPANAEK
ncbi:MFS transporter [Streptacidiphilus sp. P02-A3a]|uniref:MFS transporter n=1 Tax=Streptacidiphilus sp. P02-A3a TaxID=2704468 RepID=UPI0015F85952|nr:MFS transporter [Streptacidiphilus sp. P02-A3a]QMU72462.1 MFS transporter [Streptacidiphilus sp. P02-A3a]